MRGRAHAESARRLAARYRIGEGWETVLRIDGQDAAAEGTAGDGAAETADGEKLSAAVRFRAGWMLGDGTGTGKERQVAGALLDHWLRGRRRAFWLSQPDKLLEDARRDWTALGGRDDDVIPLRRLPALHMPRRRGPHGPNRALGPQEGVSGAIASRAVDKEGVSSPHLDAVLTGRGGKRRLGAGHEDEAKMTSAVPSPRGPSARHRRSSRHWHEDMSMTARDRLHRLVDGLPENELVTAERVLTGLSVLSLSDPVTAALAKAPRDDEPVTDREAERIEEGERDLRDGRTVTSEQVRTRLGP